MYLINKKAISYHVLILAASVHHIQFKFPLVPWVVSEEEQLPLKFMEVKELRRCCAAALAAIPGSGARCHGLAAAAQLRRSLSRTGSTALDPLCEKVIIILCLRMLWEFVFALGV